MAKNKKENFGFPVIGVSGNIVFSKKEVWAYYSIAEVPFDFLSDNAKVNLANSTMMALASLCQKADKKVDCHILSFNRPFDPSAWTEQMLQQHQKWKMPSTKEFKKFIREQRDNLLEMQYQKRQTILGVKLFNRGSIDFDSMNFLEFGYKDAVAGIRKNIDALFAINSTEIKAYDEDRAKDMEKEIYRSLANNLLKAQRLTSEELLLIIKQRLYPAMPAPYLEVNHEERLGLADIMVETTGYIEEKPRYIKINQMIDGKEYVGYRATLSFSKFGKNLSMPSSNPPFLYGPSILPFTVNCRFTLTPTEEMKKTLDRKKMETDDEIKNLEGSGQRANASIYETMADINEMDADLVQNKLPWVSGSYRVTIEAPDEDLMKTWATSLKNEYGEIDNVLSWTSGDQLQLLREEIPGGKLEINSFNHITNLAILGVSGFNFGSGVGDPVMLYKKMTNKH